MLSRKNDARELAFAWQAVLGRLQLEVTPNNFETWLRGTRALRIENETLIVQARRAGDCDWLNERLSLVVRRAVVGAMGEDLGVRFVPSSTGANGTSPAQPPAGSPAPSSTLVGSINSAFTFERYLAGEGNRLALQRCAALVEEGETPISPVVIFGPPGMGKTHLLHAVAGRAASGGQAVVCLSGEEFTNRYMAAIRSGVTHDFQAALRCAWLLVIDDLQYLAGKKGTLDELLHTIDAVMTAGGHVVVASERHPFDLDLPDRLASRLAAGIVTRIEPFAGEERREFVEARARERRVALPAWAVDRIANIEAPPVRILQGAVNAAVALQQAGQLDLRRLDAALTCISVAEGAPRPESDDDLLAAVARHFAVRSGDVAGRASGPEVREARAVAVAALKLRGRSLRQIGALLDGRNAATIKDLAEKGAPLLEACPELRARLAG
ncbi:MAG: AAA family ATPase [Chloroflexi bacterium CFX7]|nr:AAA family ATPase [Chloroflexi bacterium CFX7]MCK6564755.1 DnaA/Hda family protein [Dehalococcoidia bacterium]